MSATHPAPGYRRPGNDGQQFKNTVETAVVANTIPKGYKHTEVGVIPEDWEIHPVGRMGETLAGKALAAKAPGPRRPYLRTKNVFDGRIDISDVLSMPMTDAQFARFRLRDGDVLLNEGQSLELVGRCSIYRGEYPEPCAIQNQLVRFRARDGVSPLFASYLFRHCQQTGVFARIAMQTTSVAHLGVSRLQRLLLPWPPTEAEQQAIAEALADVDGQIEALDKLISKKQAIKTATTQQLLTGETRLNGFSAKWNHITLGTNAKFLKTGTNSRAELTTEGSVKYLHYGDIHTSSTVFLNPEETMMPFLPVERTEGLDRLLTGDLVIVDASEDLDGIGKSVEISAMSDKPIVAGLHTIAARFDKAFLADGFKAYLQFSPAFRNQLRSLAAGTKVYATNRKHIAGISMPIPDIQEQTAIAKVLSDMDDEIEVMELRREKTEVIKQGMMQQLLTGRVRLA